MAQTNINPYDPVEFEQVFVNTTIYKELVKDFDIVSFDNYFSAYEMTPRQFIGDCTHKTIFSAVPFYYLEFLTNQQPDTIYDLGCGWNVFKRYISNIVGVGAEPADSPYYYADLQDSVDADYVKGHQSYFKSVFSINALHYHPLSDIRRVVTEFVSMLAPGGTGFLALNLQRMYERDQVKFQNFSSQDLDEYIRTELSDVDWEYKVFDVDVSVPEASLDGNIRMVCQRTQ
jgi:hypothetical protein